MKLLKRIVAAVTVGVVLGVSQSALATLSNFSLVSGSGTVSDPGLYRGGGSGLNQIIPDNTRAGVGYSLNFAAGGLTISAISVTLNISGGYNGDIYAYLSHGSQSVVLLNQINGTAANGSGFDITLIGGTGNSIQTASGTAGQVLSGTTFTAYQNLNLFNTTDPSGNWTLFFADLSPGDTSTLNSFSLDITAVPEPVTLALGLFVAMLLALAGIRWAWRT